jgi:hypothetical protein
MCVICLLGALAAMAACRKTGDTPRPLTAPRSIPTVTAASDGPTDREADAAAVVDASLESTPALTADVAASPGLPANAQLVCTASHRGLRLRLSLEGTTAHLQILASEQETVCIARMTRTRDCRNCVRPYADIQFSAFRCSADTEASRLLDARPSIRLSNYPHTGDVALQILTAQNPLRCELQRDHAAVLDPLPLVEAN